jgi:hypothetical protein
MVISIFKREKKINIKNNFCIFKLQKSFFHRIYALVAFAFLEPEEAADVEAAGVEAAGVEAAGVEAAGVEAAEAAGVEAADVAVAALGVFTRGVLAGLASLAGA